MNSDLEPDGASGDFIPYLRAITALLTASHKSEDPSISDELSATLVLNSAGLTNREIASLTGKNTDAIRMAISRSKKAAVGR